MSLALTLIAAAIKYGNYAIQFGELAATAFPKVMEYMQLGYSILIRGTPPTTEEKAKIDAALEEINNVIDADVAEREKEAATLKDTDLSGK